MLTETTPMKSNSQSTINKLLQKDLKQLIVSLSSSDLISLFKNLQLQVNATSTKQFAKIGHKCIECHILFDGFKSKGYGRDEHDALINSIKIIFQTMISSSYRIQSIKKTLKYSSKFRQPLINSSQSKLGISTAKKSMKKVQGTQTIKMNKRNLQFQTSESFNKQNNSKTMNQTLDLTSTQFDQKLIVEASQINISTQKNKKLNQTEKSKKYPPISNLSCVLGQINVQKYTKKAELQQNNICGMGSNSKQCIYYEIQKHSQNELKNMRARIKLLEEQNTMLKQLMLKDFNKEFFGSKNSKGQC